MNALPRYNWKKDNYCFQVKIYSNILNLLCCLGQKKLPYHIDGVESNDGLYGCSKSYLKELSEQINNCIEDILKQLAVIGEYDKLMQSR